MLVEAVANDQLVASEARIALLVQPIEPSAKALAISEKPDIVETDDSPSILVFDAKTYDDSGRIDRVSFQATIDEAFSAVEDEHELDLFRAILPGEPLRKRQANPLSLSPLLTRFSASLPPAS